jgi:hypothetical protein
MAEGPRHDDVRFEPTDVSIGPVVTFLVFLTGTVAVLMVLLWWFQVAEIRAQDRAGHPLAAARAALPESQRWPPEPRIEGIGAPRGEASHSVTDPTIPQSAWSLRRAEEWKLAAGWTDAAGRVHTPIEEAMRRVAARYGRAGVPSAADPTATWPAASSSGRRPRDGGSP